jgi:hypothetical protein
LNLSEALAKDNKQKSTKMGGCMSKPKKKPEKKPKKEKPIKNVSLSVKFT